MQPRSARLIRPVLAAQEAGVTTHTLANYADAGRLTVVRTAGGHRRYLAVEIAELAHQARPDGPGRRDAIEPIAGQLQLGGAA